MRIALLSPGCLPWHPHGGVERHTFELARSLRREGVEVDLFTAAPEHPADPFAGDPGFRYVAVPGRPAIRRRFAVVLSRNTLYPLFTLRMGYRVARLASERRYAAVVAQGLTAFGYAFWAPRLGVSVPLVFNPHGMEEALTPSVLKRVLYAPFRALGRHAARRAAHVVATDAVLVERVRSVYGVSPQNILLVPNAIDAREAAAYVTPERMREIRERLGVGKASPLLVTVGRLAPNKGLAVGLEALARLDSAQLPDAWRWVIVGDGPDRESLRDRAGALGLLTHVVLAGTLADPDMHNLLAASDVFLNPTLYEGSSLVTLEAMSHGCAIVATRTGGIPDKIADAETGWIADPNDPKSLAQALSRCLSASGDERREVGEAARRRCLEEFDAAAAARRYLEYFARLAPDS